MHTAVSPNFRIVPMFSETQKHALRVALQGVEGVNQIMLFHTDSHRRMSTLVLEMSEEEICFLFPTISEEFLRTNPKETLHLDSSELRVYALKAVVPAFAAWLTSVRFPRNPTERISDVLLFPVRWHTLVPRLETAYYCDFGFIKKLADGRFAGEVV